MSEVIKVMECFYAPASDNQDDKVKGYILAEDYENLIPFDSDKWYELVVFAHADYCPVRKNVLLRIAHKVLELMPFYTGTWPCECFDDTFRPDIEYKVKCGYVEIEFEPDEFNMTYLAKKGQILTQAWENPENPGEWVGSSQDDKVVIVRNPIIKGLNANSPTDENGDTIYLIKRY